MKSAVLLLLTLPQLLLADGFLRDRGGRRDSLHVRGRVRVEAVLGQRPPGIGEIVILPVAFQNGYAPQPLSVPYGYERPHTFPAYAVQGGYPFSQNINVYGSSCNGGSPGQYSAPPVYVPQSYGGNGNGGG